MIFGLLCVDKPRGPTSHDIVSKVRRGTGERKVGHAGTLDPLASGVLVLALGPATRLIEYLQFTKKSYRAEIVLGVETTTFDAEGVIIAKKPVSSEINAAFISEVLAGFQGQIMQRPPAYSAIKVAGKAAYSRARAGETVLLAERPTEIFRIEIVAYSAPTLVLDIDCSPGTYIRSLAHDLGKLLGIGGMLSGLERTATGDFTLSKAVGWEELQSALSDGAWHQYIMSADLALMDRPKIILGPEDARRIGNGMPIDNVMRVNGVCRAYTPHGVFCAVLESRTNDDQLHPIKVFSGLIQTWLSTIAANVKD